MTDSQAFRVSVDKAKEVLQTQLEPLLMSDVPFHRIDNKIAILVRALNETTYMRAKIVALTKASCSLEFYSPFDSADTEKLVVPLRNY